MITENDAYNNTKIIDYSNKILEELHKNKDIYVVWSGGCDSTLVLDDLRLVLKDDPRVITAISFVHGQLASEKLIWERQKRNEYLALNNKENKIKHIEINIEKAFIQVGEQSCVQPAMWLSNIIPIINNKSIVFMGYHKGDDFFTYSVFSSWLKAFCGLSNLFGKEILFSFPYIHSDKKEIIKTLKTRNIYEQTWYCENPLSNGKICGYCEPCKTHKVALSMIEEDKKTDIISTTLANDLVDIAKKLKADKIVEKSPETISYDNNSVVMPYEDKGLIP
jgi:7-cyano-7-deazaguanine synthase in queuosine biosynthesis